MQDETVCAALRHIGPISCRSGANGDAYSALAEAKRSEEGGRAIRRIVENVWTSHENDPI